ncbi:MAG: molybdopterin-dependent oxidoreductase [Anaerolineales bacterium]|nr:molybdopterin-dependent oxidoreductase [Anaerolineales bacterium]
MTGDKQALQKEKLIVGTPQTLRETDFDPVGKSVVRKDVIPKVTGKAIYAGDLHMPGMLIGKVLLSAQPHALIKGIDISAAAAVPGVKAVLTAQDIPGENVFGIAIPDQQVLADRKVRFIGEPVAVVAAEDAFAAEQAVSKIRVEYEPLPAVFNPIDGLKPGAPLVHEKGNILYHTKVRKGNIEKGFDEASVIVENIYRTAGQDHAPIEPEAGFSWIDAEGVLNVFTSTQYAFRDRRQIAVVLNLPMNRVRVANMTMGGGFGRKDDVTTEILVALLAWKTGRPVRLVYTRHEAMLTQTHRHPTYVRVRTGANKEGRLTAMEGVIYGDTGAYSSLGIFVIKKMALHLGGPYYYPNYKSDSFSVYTNNPIYGPFRGFGVLQAAVSHEGQIDELAEKLGMDPLEFRLKNCLRPGLSFSTGQVMTEACGIGATLERLQQYMVENGLSFERPQEVSA